LSPVDWPEGAEVPVFLGDRHNAAMVGFTTLKVTAASAGRDPVPFGTQGRAIAIPVETESGGYLAWLVVEGEAMALPDFRPIEGMGE
jgi:hypothetical protein